MSDGEGVEPHAAADALADRVRAFIDEIIVPYERDPRWGTHGPDDALVQEMRDHARSRGLLTPNVRPDGTHLSHRDTAKVLRAAGHSPLGPVALNVAAPDEGNIYLLSHIATDAQRARYLAPLIEGRTRSAFFMTEPAAEDGAGSDPSLLKTTAVRDGEDWIIRGRKAFITGADGAEIGLLIAATGAPGSHAATMFVFDMPDPAVVIERSVRTIDGCLPGGHCIVRFDDLRLGADAVLGEVDLAYRYAQVRLGPARLTHCMRWRGACTRANDIAARYAVSRRAFGKPLIDHEGVGFMLADNAIALRQAELMIDWCAGLLDAGEPAGLESSMTKVAVSEALFQVADRCVQIMGGLGVSEETVVEQVFRELRAFRIYDGPTEVHKWSIAKTIKRSLASAG
ncbi:acyl-CoA dehydrogenase [Hephaestia caeni]|uniref:Acyl-CoA dehydrogenase n=1 Tax=Hephaestia caeni TaxID=645617 RepID=A0A397NK77_9SPHN|nr:acyl-CoA dehydrogenase [Hephaestia caeni]RIA37960.1 acyl-CoA dehydrogenase [Hephaestia caeni]